MKPVIEPILILLLFSLVYVLGIILDNIAMLAVGGIIGLITIFDYAYFLFFDRGLFQDAISKEFRL